MRVVERLAREKHVWLDKMTSATVNIIWSTVAPMLFEKYGKETQLKNVTIGWKSKYNQMSDTGAFARNRNQC